MSSSAQTIVVGADGLLGSSLVSELRRCGNKVIGTTRRAERVASGETVFFDLAISEIGELPHADVVFICAAMTRFAECRTEPQLAERVIFKTPEALGALVTSRGSRVVFLSTSAVLDCKEPMMRADRPRDGASDYGRYKAEAERRLLALGPLATVVRLTKILAPSHPLFKGWVDSLRIGHVIKAFNDHRIAPITVKDAIDALMAIGQRGSDGVYQVSGAADVSYYEIATHIAGKLGVSQNCVEGCGAEEGGIPPDEVQPFTSLDASRLSRLSGFCPPEPYSVIDGSFLTIAGNR